MAGTDASEGQVLWQPGGAEEDSSLHEGNRHLHLAYDDEEEEVVVIETLRFLSKLTDSTVTNGISFHARVGCFSPFCIRWSVAIAVISFWLHLVVLVFPCFSCPRISSDTRFPRAPLFLCRERKALVVGDMQLRL